MANFHAASQLICIRFVFFVSLLEFIYNIIAFVCSNISAIHIQQFCNLMQNICNCKSVFQSNYKKITIIHHSQFLTSNNNSPSSPAMGFELMTPGLPAQCLIHSSTRSLIEKHENLPILTHIRLLQFDTKYLQLDTKYFHLDTKYLQSKMYFSIQTQNICNGKSVFQSRYKIIVNLS